MSVLSKEIDASAVMGMLHQQVTNSERIDQHVPGYTRFVRETERYAIRHWPRFCAFVQKLNHPTYTPPQSSANSLDSRQNELQSEQASFDFAVAIAYIRDFKQAGQIPAQQRDYLLRTAVESSLSDGFSRIDNSENFQRIIDARTIFSLTEPESNDTKQYVSKTLLRSVLRDWRIPFGGEKLAGVPSVFPLLDQLCSADTSLKARVLRSTRAMNDSTFADPELYKGLYIQEPVRDRLAYSYFVSDSVSRRQFRDYIPIVAKDGEELVNYGSSLLLQIDRSMEFAREIDQLSQGFSSSLAVIADWVKAHPDDFKSYVDSCIRGEHTWQGSPGREAGVHHQVVDYRDRDFKSEKRNLGLGLSLASLTLPHDKTWNPIFQATLEFSGYFADPAVDSLWVGHLLRWIKDCGPDALAYNSNTAFLKIYRIYLSKRKYPGLRIASSYASDDDKSKFESLGALTELADSYAKKVRSNWFESGQSVPLRALTLGIALQPGAEYQKSINELYLASSPKRREVIQRYFKVKDFDPSKPLKSD
ncbi:MAG: hypothetical protein JST12_08530 [Armatimonadetes bacterium]|nr:hypothetical protein [Armatimonadota bacterium]